ncbi:MAG: DEAD/DEAH box helicase family protein [Myxococcota bacterium]|nr:DEAD/DEAH box helicase family protein [Myxococcota bacterium]
MNKKSKIRWSNAIGLEDIPAAERLRPYQVRAVAQCAYALKHESARTCLVAPPGAGKTRCAFHIAALMDRPIEVRVPTRALVNQWQTRSQVYFLDAFGRNPPQINVSTYAAKEPFESGALIILDEAHHLVASWGKEILDTLTGAHKVLGLTGTPPYGNRGWNTFTELVGDSPIEILAPPLVRDGHLAPYLDLVWPVLSSPDEVPALWDLDQKLTQLERKHQTHIHRWSKKRLEEDLEELTEQRFVNNERLLISLCRYHFREKIEIPLDLPRDPEFFMPMTLHDRAILLWNYGEHIEDVRRTVLETGFRSIKRGFVRMEDIAQRNLASSASRIRGCIDVLKLEAYERVDGLRALILTDRDVEGDKISARGLLKALLRDSEVNKLDPILVTGSAFWVDQDLSTKFIEQFPDLEWVESDDHFEIHVSKWSTAERVALATRFLEQGSTRCLIGTRHLLGEGWDCPAVNCVIDLTGISTSVTTNQIRGRALRTDTHDPAKVASLWEIMSVAPNLCGGDRMLERLVDKYDHTFGIDADGKIRSGVARIDPLLTRSLHVVSNNIDTLRTRMKARLQRPEKAMKLWRKGEVYADQTLWKLSIAATETSNEIRPDMNKKRSLRTTKSSFRVSWKESPSVNFMMALALSALDGVALLSHTIQLEYGLIASLPGIFFLLRAWLLSRTKDYRKQLKALHIALKDNELVTGELHFHEKEGWIDSNEEESRIFVEAAKELLEPVKYPRYIIIDKKERIFAVPGVLGANKDLARSFVFAWEKKVGPCRLLFARQGEGRQKLKEAWLIEPTTEINLHQIWQ